MNDLAHDLLLQIHEQQVENAKVLGRIEEKIKTHIDTEGPQMTKMQADVEGLKETKWRQAGFLGAIVMAFQPIAYVIMKKVWP